MGMNNLESELASHRKATDFNIESDTITDSLRARDSEVSHPLVGDVAPMFSLPNENGKEESLAELLTKGPVIITFFKGDWCSYCDLELKAMQRALPEFEKHGATVVAISPHTVTISQSLKEKKQLDYTILSDAGNRIAEEYGLRFPMQEELMDLMSAFGLEDMTPMHGEQGDNTNTLPIPGTFVVNMDGKIIYSFVDSDHTKRAEPSDIVACLMSVA